MALDHQLWKLLLFVDQSPNNVMKEALSSPMKALVAGSLLEHPSMDVKVSVASCLCEITIITAPEAPYSDKELKGVFQCIVSSLENLSDKSSRFYDKRVSILDSISKVRSRIIMLDPVRYDVSCKVECIHSSSFFIGYDKTITCCFFFLFRDHHHGMAFSLMGVLPVARKLVEEVIKKSDKIQPYLNKAMTDLNDSLAQYSQVLTSVCEGTTHFAENNAESASVQKKYCRYRTGSGIIGRCSSGL
ncbi:putative sister chromatid cohesion protein Pds5 [Helianthus anomalus]